MANSLILYEGAVRRKMTMDVEAADESSGVSSESTEFEPGQTMSMSEALAHSSKGSDAGVFDTYNRESQKAGLGDLFEYETA